MLRVEDSFELRDSVLRARAPQFRQYHVVEQVFERPLWIARVLPMRELKPGGDAPRWSRYISSSTRGLLGIATNPDWERVQVHVVLPDFMCSHGAMKLARCITIWEAMSTAAPVRSTWVFDTDCGAFTDPEFGLDLRAVRRDALCWRDCEDDWDENGGLKL
ncbi:MULTISPECIES: hypothetical protein [unclassified Variovorax]|jgi:hypothetical protein|uniref:hypothetical protein n=1 Tax=unclassified Variovorax TaxID=663243 RepID=UPI000F7E9C44|nr:MULTISPECIES: hypothetical protein [unclassified Variovorax]RSZ38216.1 hypothetical protein EJO70_18930 [Variovorax sp. 553]RSZ39333.1 hypothetical protein EJO71_20320 [Variovorax sp. 679]